MPFYIERTSKEVNLHQQGSAVEIELVLPVIREFITMRFLMTDKYISRKRTLKISHREMMIK